jgi:hypothetical protein
MMGHVCRHSSDREVTYLFGGVLYGIEQAGDWSFFIARCAHMLRSSYYGKVGAERAMRHEPHMTGGT